MADYDDAVAEAESSLREARQAAHELRLTEKAFEGLRQAGMDAIISAGPGDENRRKVERLIVCLQTLDAVKQMLVMTASQGDAANHALAWAEQNSLLRR